MRLITKFLSEKQCSFSFLSLKHSPTQMLRESEHRTHYGYMEAGHIFSPAKKTNLSRAKAQLPQSSENDFLYFQVRSLFLSLHPNICHFCSSPYLHSKQTSKQKKQTKTKKSVFLQLMGDLLSRSRFLWKFKVIEHNKIKERFL